MSSANNCNPYPPNLQELLHKLEFISMIPVNNKPCIKTMSFVEKGSWWGAFQRTLAREDKKSLMEYINQVINDSMKAINEFKDTEFLADIVNSLSNCKTGLTNLRTTYQDYPDTSAQLRVIMKNIDIQLEKNIAVLQGTSH